MIKVNKPWPGILIAVGNIAMLAGVIDPLEGSILILIGSGLVWSGSLLGRVDRSLKTYRMRVFILILIGVGALWGFSMAGGFGGSSGISNWWMILILPYPAGLIMGICGPGFGRWQQWSGIGIGMLVLFIAGFALAGPGPAESGSNTGFIVLAALGLLIIAGCIYRLKTGRTAT